MDEIYAQALARFDDAYVRAQAASAFDASAMSVATVDGDGRPALRIVLLKGHDARGFVFYTNYDSRKGQELAANPHAALCFYWQEMYEQIRIEGECVRVGEAEGDAYFASRERMSQIGAWASQQSQALDSRATFERDIEQVEKRFTGRDVPRPPHWSGYRLVPRRIEFWRGLEGRLHERTAYWLEQGAWHTGLLYP
ncbi:MAG: pyridoxamine 5'-phosphate oxidase [Gammaproteobacteria bacterium]|jgi:pyridoxamine 5'-phosphate oxidase